MALHEIHTDPAKIEQGTEQQYGDHDAPREGHIIPLGTTIERDYGGDEHTWQYQAKATAGLAYVLQRREESKGPWKLAPGSYGSVRDSLGRTYTYSSQEWAIREFCRIADKRSVRQPYSTAYAPEIEEWPAALATAAEAMRTETEHSARHNDYMLGPVLRTVLDAGAERPRLLLAVRDPRGRDHGPFYVAVPLDDPAVRERVGAALGLFRIDEVARLVREDDAFRLADLPRE